MPRVLLRWREPEEIARDPVPEPRCLRPALVLGLGALFCVLSALGSHRHRASFEWPGTPIISLLLAFGLVYGQLLFAAFTASWGWITDEAVGRRRRGVSTYARFQDVAGAQVRQVRPGGPAVLEVRRKGGASFTIGLDPGLSWARVRKLLRDLGVPDGGQD